MTTYYSDKSLHDVVQQAVQFHQMTVAEYK